MIWPVTILATLIGLLLVGIPGALLGLVIGVIVDRKLGIVSWAELKYRLSRNKPVYAAEHVRFMLLGHLAKLNGRVLPAHIKQARAEMRRLKLSGYKYQAAITAFSQGKDAKLEDMRSSLQAGFKGKDAEKLLLVCWQIVWAERRVSPRQRVALNSCARWLGISSERLSQLESFVMPAAGSPSPRAPRQAQLEYALRVLGLNTTEKDFARIQRRYRKLLSDNHPDKLIGAGASKQRVAQANDKTKALHDAYAILRRHFQDR